MTTCSVRYEPRLSDKARSSEASRFSITKIWYAQQVRTQRGGVGLTPPLELDILQKLCYLHKGDYLFSDNFCLLFCRLMQIPRNKFACKFQGTFENGPKSSKYSRLPWESALSLASRHHLTNFCRHFVYYACLRLCSAIVCFIQNSCLYFVC